IIDLGQLLRSWQEIMGRFGILNLINKLHPLLGAERWASYFEALPETASSMPMKANFRQMMLVSQTKLEENPMKIIETKQRSPLLIAQLTDTMGEIRSGNPPLFIGHGDPKNKGLCQASFKRNPPPDCCRK
ncbi:hypothetical protein HMPREF9103_02319, partial [Lentilactobacillus parafarraginis F0439]